MTHLERWAIHLVAWVEAISVMKVSGDPSSADGTV